MLMQASFQYNNLLKSNFFRKRESKTKKFLAQRKLQTFHFFVKLLRGDKIVDRRELSIQFTKPINSLYSLFKFLSNILQSYKKHIFFRKSELRIKILFLIKNFRNYLLQTTFLSTFDVELSRWHDLTIGLILDTN